MSVRTRSCMVFIRPFAVLAAVSVVVRAWCAAAEPLPTAAPVLRVGTSGDYAPFSVRAADGAPRGFDIAVAERVAPDFGRPLTFVSVEWPELVPQLRAGRFDVAMSGVTIRADRAVTLRFTRPYAVGGAVVVVRAAQAARFDRLEDVNQAGVRLAVNAGGHLERVARQHFPLATITPLRDNTALPSALSEGTADAVVSDSFEARTWSGDFKMVGPFTRDRKAYAVGPEALDLRGALDAWLAAREADGWLNAQRRQWLGDAAMWTAQDATLEALVSAIDLRLQLMPVVAAVKRRAGLPVEDPAQEARVLERARASATPLGLEPTAVAAFFRVQMETAKAVEHATDAPAEPAAELPSLETIRAAVAAVSEQLIQELARGMTWWSDPAVRGRLERSLHEGLQAPAAAPYVPRMVDAVVALGRDR